MRIFSFPLAASMAVLMLAACSARADIGAPPTPPPIPTAQPQVIVIQPATPQPARDDTLIIGAFITLAACAGVVAGCITGYKLASRESAPAQPQPYSQASGRYLVNMDAREFAEFQALQHYKLTQGRRDIEVRR